MKLRFSSVVAGCAAAVMLTSFALAQPRIGGGAGGGGPAGGSPGSGQQQLPGAGGGQLIQGTTPELTMQMLQSAGFSALEIFTDEKGQRHVRGTSSDVKMAVWHQNCSGNSCASVTFTAAFAAGGNVDANWINAWNVEYRFIRGYLAQNGNSLFLMDVWLANVPASYIAEVGRIWNSVIGNVSRFQPSGR